MREKNGHFLTSMREIFRKLTALRDTSFIFRPVFVNFFQDETLYEFLMESLS